MVFDRRPMRKLAQHGATEHEPRSGSDHPAEINCCCTCLAPGQPLTRSARPDTASATPIASRIVIGSGMTRVCFRYFGEALFLLGPFKADRDVNSSPSICIFLPTPKSFRLILKSAEKPVRSTHAAIIDHLASLERERNRLGLAVQAQVAGHLVAAFHRLDGAALEADRAILLDVEEIRAARWLSRPELLVSTLCDLIDMLNDDLAGSAESMTKPPEKLLKRP